MKKSLLVLSLTLLYFSSFSQERLSAETKKFVVFKDSIIVFKDAVLIDGTGTDSRSHQSVIIKDGKINWIGDDAKAIIPQGAKTIDLNGKALMP
ncbi:MAG: hypothetical protein ABI266_08360, partial [Ginsengibacter sp.]